MKVKYGNLKSIKIIVILALTMLHVIKTTPAVVVPEYDINKTTLNNFFQKVWYKGYVPAVLDGQVVTTPGYHDIRFYFTTQEANMIDTSDKDARENLINFNRKYACDNNKTTETTDDDVFFSSYNFKYKDGQNSLYENLLEYIPNQYFRIPKKSKARFFIWDISNENKAIADDEYINFKVSVFYTMNSADSFTGNFLPGGSFNNKRLLVCSDTKCCRYEQTSTSSLYPTKIINTSVLTYISNPSSSAAILVPLWNCN